MYKKVILLVILAVTCLEVKAQTVAQHHIDLTWTDSNSVGVTSQNIYRAVGNCATVPSSSFVVVGSVSGTATSFSDTTVTQTPPAGGTSYCYAITAVNTGGESVFSNLSQAVLLPFPPPPNPPTNLITKPF